MKSKEEIRELAIERYGSDINTWGCQRDGFIEGYKKAQLDMRGKWTKIESESDLPKDKTTQYSVCKDKKVFQSTVNCGTVINWYNIGKISHYQPIKKPEPPLY